VLARNDSRAPIRSTNEWKVVINIVINSISESLVIPMIISARRSWIFHAITRRRHVTWNLWNTATRARARWINNRPLVNARSQRVCACFFFFYLPLFFYLSCFFFLSFFSLPFPKRGEVCKRGENEARAQCFNPIILPGVRARDYENFGRRAGLICFLPNCKESRWWSTSDVYRRRICELSRAVSGEFGFEKSSTFESPLRTLRENQCRYLELNRIVHCDPMRFYV